MPVPNPTMPVKGAGTTLWVYKGSGDPYANPLSDVDWSRLAKVKDLTPGELTAESYDDSYLDDEDADWTATGQGQKSAGDTSFTLAWMPGEQGQQALLAWFNEGDTRAYKIRLCVAGRLRASPPVVVPYCLRNRTALNRTPTAPAHPVRIWVRKPHRRLITALNPRITPGLIRIV